MGGAYMDRCVLDKGIKKKKKQTSESYGYELWVKSAL